MPHDTQKTVLERMPAETGSAKWPRASISALHGAARAIWGAARAMWRRLLRLAWLVLHRWPERHRQRTQLRELEPRLLRDIGLDREEAMREARKPFWL